MISLPLLTALLACIPGSAWPHQQRWQDTGFAPPTQPTDFTPTLPCNRPNEGTVAQLTVQNPNPVAYRLSQMDGNCAEQFVAVVQPNDAYQATVGNHVMWVVRDANDGYIRVFGIPSGSNVQWVETLP